MIKASDFGFEVVKNNSTNDKNSMYIMWSSCTYIVEICYNNVILYEALIEYWVDLFQVNIKINGHSAKG